MVYANAFIIQKLKARLLELKVSIISTLIANNLDYPLKAVAVVLDDLASHGHLEWIDKAKKTRAHVFYRTPAQWGETIYAYARDNGLVNAVCTMYELTESEESEGQPFHNLDQEVLVKALKTLEVQKKAEIFGSNEGVKFF